MAILNVKDHGLPSVLAVLYKTLLLERSLSREELLALCVPPHIGDNQMASRTLARWLELGLFEENDGKIEISRNLPRETRDIRYGPERLQTTLRRLVQLKENNSRFWDTDASRSADLTRALCWILAQDVYTYFPKGYADVETMNKRQITGDVVPFSIDRTWVAFKLWAPYLGFAWNARYPVADALVIDPTPAIRDELPVVFSAEKVLDISRYLSRLASVLPVLDGGQYRKMLEDKMDPRHWPRPGANELSTSLSRALMRLNTTGLISLEDRSDAPDRRLLIGRERKIIRGVTHVCLEGGRS